ncbi:MAG: homoserine kinase [Fimbriimonadaceae bacterium]|nr:homoserine kinase [Alphaproteobacteria bacterium]
MAVYTEVSDSELTAFIASYDVGALLSFRGITEGVENSNYLLHTETGPLILTLYEKRVNEDDLPFFLGLMHHLADRGLNCPTPIADREGNTLRQLAGRPAALISFLEGMWVRRPYPEHCAALGTVLAKFHIGATDFKLTRENALAPAGWPPLFAGSRNQADTVVPGLANEIETELAFLAQNWPRGLPQGIIHADLFPDNVFFLGDTLSGIIDFYFACNDILAYDIAICLNAWCFETDNSFNVTKARALLRAYADLRQLSEAEYNALPILARGAAMRFLLTRLYDWIHTPPDALVKPHNPVEYVKKLRFHRGISNAGEYGLDHS